MHVIKNQDVLVGDLVLPGVGCELVAFPDALIRTVGRLWRPWQRSGRWNSQASPARVIPVLNLYCWAFLERHTSTVRQRRAFEVARKLLFCQLKNN